MCANVLAEGKNSYQNSGCTVKSRTIFDGGYLMQVRDVMTPLRDCFMLASNLRLNFQTMLAIYKSGGFL